MHFIFKIMTECMENGVYDKTCVWCLSIIIYSNMTKMQGRTRGVH